ncbi:Glycogen synthase [BD1-7 clade bacterium]|uniref:Glycogen synthase n=1 Tax=BD1-7 clade bacterium TaxID=2029982 RepID=A0A5S9N3Q9_9GAMM|nr:Glycogen synthase [BD1-7 clade bacterium]CAA0084405.1 Glycogen synthase [BD1-7 clade bacterium]
MKLAKESTSENHMKVLHVFKTYLPDSMGGIQQCILQMSQATAKLGIDNHVLSLSPNPKTGYDPGTHSVTQCKTTLEFASTPVSLEAVSTFRRLAAEADLIHYHFPYPFADLLHFLGQHNKPTLVTYHSDIVKQKYLLKAYQPLMHRFLQSVDRIVATSPNYVVSSQVLQRFRDKVDVVPIGLDPRSYPSVSINNVSKWQSRFGRRFFLFLGVLRYYKGLETLLEAAEHTRLPIVIAGDGPLGASIREKAQQARLHNVHFLGHVSEHEKVELLQACYAVVFPSDERSEAFGISLLEGAIHQKPLISCEIGTGTSYVNKLHETGLTVPPKSPLKLAAAMELLWEHEEYAEKMGCNAYQRFAELFTAEKMADSYFHIYQTLLNSPETAAAGV